VHPSVSLKDCVICSVVVCRAVVLVEASQENGYPSRFAKRNGGSLFGSKTLRERDFESRPPPIWRAVMGSRSSKWPRWFPPLERSTALPFFFFAYLHCFDRL